MPDPSRKRLFILITASAVLLVCSFVIGAAEWYLRLNGQVAYFGRFIHDSRVGWRFYPDTRFTFRSGGIENDIRTNHEGFREFRSPPPGPTRTIAVFGDSFTSNLAVKDQEVFTSVMADELKGGGWAVKNYGINGFGTVQEFLLYQDVVARDGPFDLVILNFFGANDFDDNAFPWMFVEGRDRPYLARDEQGHLAIGGLPVERNLWLDIKSFLMFHLEIVRRLYRPTKIQTSGFDKATRELWPYPKLLLLKPSLFRYGIESPPEQTLAIEKSTAQFIRMFNDEAAKNGSRFLAVLAPSQPDLLTDAERAEVQKQMGFLPGWKLVQGEPYGRMKNSLSELGVPSLDLTSAFEAQPVSTTYNDRESHWTAAGNRIAARAISDWVWEHTNTPAVHTPPSQK